MAQRKRIQLETMRFQVQSLASFSGLRIWHCHDLRCRSQTWLGSGIAVAVAVVQAGSCSSDQTPSLGTSICCGCGPKKTKDKKKKKSIQPLVYYFSSIGGKNEWVGKEDQHLLAGESEQYLLPLGGGWKHSLVFVPVNTTGLGSQSAAPYFDRKGWKISCLICITETMQKRGSLGIWLQQGGYFQNCILFCQVPLGNGCPWRICLSVSLVFSLPLGDSKLDSFSALCPGYMGGKKETQGIHHSVIPQVSRSLDSPHSCFHLLDHIPVCVLWPAQEREPWRLHLGRWWNCALYCSVSFITFAGGFHFSHALLQKQRF